MTICIYPGNCIDGFAASWVIRKKIPEAICLPVSHGDAIPEFETGEDVILVDFSYSREDIIAIARKSRTVMILDHHKSAQLALVDLPPNVAVLIDLNYSGSMLAWKYCFGEASPPRLLDVIQDSDLLRFSLAFTKEITAALFSYPYSYDLYDYLMTEDLTDLMKDGEAILRKQEKDIAEMLPILRHYRRIGGWVVPCANLPYTLSGAAALVMAREHPFAACYYDSKCERVYMLRSLEGGIDVSKIATIYGGGGNANAAAFRVKNWHVLSEAPPLVQEELSKSEYKVTGAYYV